MLKVKPVSSFKYFAAISLFFVNLFPIIFAFPFSLPLKFSSVAVMGKEKSRGPFKQSFFSSIVLRHVKVTFFS